MRDAVNGCPRPLSDGNDDRERARSTELLVSNAIAKTLRSILYRIGYRMVRLDRPFDFEAFLHLLLNEKGKVFFFFFCA